MSTELVLIPVRGQRRNWRGFSPWREGRGWSSELLRACEGMDARCGEEWLSPCSLEVGSELAGGLQVKPEEEQPDWMLGLLP